MYIRTRPNGVLQALSDMFKFVVFGHFFKCKPLDKRISTTLRLHDTVIYLKKNT